VLCFALVPFVWFDRSLQKLRIFSKAPGLFSLVLQSDFLGAQGGQLTLHSLQHSRFRLAFERGGSVASVDFWVDRRLSKAAFPRARKAEQKEKVKYFCSARS